MNFEHSHSHFVLDCKPFYSHIIKLHFKIHLLRCCYKSWSVFDLRRSISAKYSCRYSRLVSSAFPPLSGLEIPGPSRPSSGMLFRKPTPYSKSFWILFCPFQTIILFRIAPLTCSVCCLKMDFYNSMLPGEGKPLEIECPLPPELLDVLQMLSGEKDGIVEGFSFSRVSISSRMCAEF